jgi:hypothetical protein
METGNIFRPNRDRISANQPALTASASSSAKPKLVDQVRKAIRTRRYSDRTEKVYTHVLNRGGKGVRSPANGL